MTLVSTVTVGAGGAANITFSSIAGTATDLVLVLSGRLTTTAEAWSIAFNSDTTNSNYFYRYLNGTGSSVGTGSAGAGSRFAGQINSSSTTANTFGNQTIYITNYSGSANKSWSSDFVWETNATFAWQYIGAHIWTSTSAITSITLTPNLSSTWEQNTTASLYLITKGSGGATVS
jgi:hypothetical protein